MKLKHIVESFIDDKVEIDEDGFLESVSNYNSYGKNIYREGNLAETANTLAEIAKSATIHAVRETGDAFDKITVTRNMKELKQYSDQFSKVATEASTLQQRMEGLYEDMGRILGRYYEINSIDESIAIGESSLDEATKFDVKKMQNLVKQDKFLTYVVKKDYKGKIDDTVLKTLYWSYVKGDKDMEKLYSNIR